MEGLFYFINKYSILTLKSCATRRPMLSGHGLKKFFARIAPGISLYERVKNIFQKITRIGAEDWGTYNVSKYFYSSWFGEVYSRWSCAQQTPGCFASSTSTGTPTTATGTSMPTRLRIRTGGMLAIRCLLATIVFLPPKSVLRREFLFPILFSSLRAVGLFRQSYP